MFQMRTYLLIDVEMSKMFDGNMIYIYIYTNNMMMMMMVIMMMMMMVIMMMMMMMKYHMKEHLEAMTSMTTVKTVGMQRNDEIG